MKRAFIPVLVLLCTVGCGDDTDKYEAVWKDIIKSLNDLIDALESVKDKETAKAAAVKIDEISDRLEALWKRANALPNLSKSNDERLLKKHQAELKKVAERVRKASVNAALKCDREPAFLDALDRLAKTADSLQKRAKK